MSLLAGRKGSWGAHARIEIAIRLRTNSKRADDLPTRFLESDTGVQTAAIHDLLCCYYLGTHTAN